MKYPLKIGVALTQLLNAFFGGYPDESTSSRAWRQRRKPFWGFMLRLIDGVFFWQSGHCERAWQAEMQRRQLPPELRVDVWFFTSSH